MRLNSSKQHQDPLEASPRESEGALEEELSTGRGVLRFSSKIGRKDFLEKTGQIDVLNGQMTISHGPCPCPSIFCFL